MQADRRRGQKTWPPRPAFSIAQLDRCSTQQENVLL